MISVTNPHPDDRHRSRFIYFEAKPDSNIAYWVVSDSGDVWVRRKTGGTYLSGQSLGQMLDRAAEGRYLLVRADA